MLLLARMPRASRGVVVVVLVGLGLLGPPLGCGGSPSGDAGGVDGGSAASQVPSDGGSAGADGGTDGGAGGGGGGGGGSGAAAACGDGVLAVGEACDDRNTVPGDGCSATCQLESGWACPTVGQACHRPACADGVKEGAEQCDDGQALPFDGCSSDCKLELDCTKGACTGFCGDGIVSPGETCDDGNSVDRDGCSGGCTLEHLPGVTCTDTASTLPDAIDVPVLFRDFRGVDEASVAGVGACPTGLGPFEASRALGCAHPDFEAFWGAAETPSLLAPALAPLSTRPHVLMPSFEAQTGGKHAPHDPAFSDVQITSAGTFAQWYQSVPGVNRTIGSTLHLNRVPGTSTYAIDRSANAGGFFPLDATPSTYPCPAGQACGFGATPVTVGTGREHDYGFTTETRYQFTFQGGEALTFTGDDDVWVFIGGKLAVDLGGLHPATTKTLTLDDATAARLGLVQGQIYEMALFHAERHTPASNFTLTLGGYIKNTTVCKSTCGDGVVALGEQCDLGPENGKSAGCSATCTLEPVIAQ